ncbi:MAG: ParB/RepB/Spo0J family partition protein, partial [Anaerolineae bacterium]|nr:ParB/RepB/Spo0J family partition protein [Anaerolineae bacterium]
MNTVHTLDLHLAQIVPSRWQPRQHFDPDALQELARSIIDQGLINPVLVFLQNHHYELIAGERRTRAVAALTLWQLFPNAHNLRDWCARLAAVGLTGLGDAEYAALANEPSARIRAAIYPADDLAALHLLAVTENLDRADLSPLEEAYAYKGLMDAYAWSQRDLADRVNKSQSYIAQRLALLNLGAAALDALSTQVLTLTHARAIAAVPEKIQDAATTWAIRATGKDDTPATTRQVENQMRAIAAFADPARWQPNGEHVYTPQQRNRLGVIRMLISGPFAAERVAQNLQSLLEFKNYYETRNLVTSKPLTIVEDDSLYAGVTNALGMRPQDAWQNYAVSEKRECHTCELYGANPGVYHPGIKPCCPRWTAKYTDAGPCENHLGPFDPVVIPVDDYDIRQEFAENPASESLVIQEPFAHTRDVAAYAEAYRSAVEKRQERQKAGDEAKVNGPRRAAQEFWEWQQSLP